MNAFTFFTVSVVGLLSAAAALYSIVTSPGDMEFECRQQAEYACPVEECPTAPSAPSEECIALLREIDGR